MNDSANREWSFRPATSGDMTDILATVRMAFGATRNASRPACWDAFGKAEGAIVAHPTPTPGRIVGVSARVPLQVSFPYADGAAPHNVHAITDVAVRPDRERQGVLQCLMAGQLLWAREHGFGWSALIASSPRIYGRFGYGIATNYHSVTMGISDLYDLDINVNAYSMDLLPICEESIAMHQKVWADHARRVPGTVVLGQEIITARNAKDPLDERISVEPKIAVLHRDNKVLAAAYVEHLATGDQNLQILVGATEEARTALVWHMCNIRKVITTRVWNVASDDQLVFAGTGPRGKDMSTLDGIWLRPVHLGAALWSLHWRNPIHMVVELSDAIPGTDKRVAVEAHVPGKAQVESTDQAPDLTISSTLLGAVSLGAYSVHGGLQLGSYTEHRPGAAAELVAALRGIRAPCTATEF